MLIKIPVKPKHLKDYRGFIPDSQYKNILKYAQKLKGLKVAHVNATQRGGGPAEIFKGLIPLMRDVGLNAEWYIIPSNGEFHRVMLTKKLHLGLQGGKKDLTEGEKQSYVNASRILAKMAAGVKPDVWVMHDPQPLGGGYFLEDKKPKILRVHIDLSNPNKDMWKFLYPLVAGYDKTIFHMKEFVPKNFPKKKTAVFPVAIDPLLKKNTKMDLKKAKKIAAKHGIDPSKPLLVNISRFDRLKDPLGMVKAWRLAKKKIPALQFVFAGLMIASDDPEAVEVCAEVKKETAKDKDIYLFSDPGKIHTDVETFVRAFQTAADVIIHKSIYEGFGLVVTEAMLKGKPVVAGNVGGLRLQIKNGKNGFLVNSPEEAAEKAVKLIQNPGLMKKLGREAEKSASANFLMPRLLLDYLKLFSEVLKK